MIYRVRPHLPVALLLGVASCLDPQPPFLRGTITSRAADVYAVQTGSGVRLDSTAAMFVDGGPSCDQKAKFFIGGNTQVFRRGLPADTGQLVVGAVVIVWNSGMVLQSCPPQTGAVRVSIE